MTETSNISTILISALGVLSTVITVLWRKSSQDAQAEINRGLAREDKYWAVRDKDLVNSTENTKSLILVAERLDNIEALLQKRGA